MHNTQVSGAKELPALPREGVSARWFVMGLGLIILVPLLLVGLFLWQSGMFGSSSTRTLSPGMPAPDFTLNAQDGRPFRLANYKGRAVFLAFVPSWDDPKTLAEVRSLASSAQTFDAAGAKVMVVSSDDKAKAKALHEKEKLPFPLLQDEGKVLAKRYGVPQGENYRTTFVVDPAGGVKYRVGDAAVEAERHGPQLLDVSKCCIDEIRAARSHGIGNTVGDYSLPHANGHGMETLFGSASAQQKLTVVLFLSVECPCSNSYNARIALLAKLYQSRGVRVVGVYSNRNETAKEIADHARLNGFEFPILRDERALCADHLGASITPEVFVLDSKRVLRYAGRFDNSRDPAEVKTQNLMDALDALLAGQEPKLGDTHAFGCAIVR
jgi:peroxiredoxin